MKHVPALLLVACLGVLLAGCRREAVYTEESFSTDSPFKLKVTEAVPVACESARRSLLGQGYLIDTVAGEQVKGRKAYRRDDSLNTFIEMNVVCVADRKGSTLYANGVLSTYDLKKSGNSASVGISAVGSISLPFGQSADSLVKIAEETIEDKAFYGRFFAAVGHVLKEMEDRPDEDASAPEKTGPASATKPAPDADIPLEQGPVDVPGIVPEPGPAPSSPSIGGPVIVPEPGAAPAAGGIPAASGAPAKSTAPGPVQGFSVSAPASAQPATPATQGPSVPAQVAPLPASPAPVTTPAASTQPDSTQPTQTETVPPPASTAASMPTPRAAIAPTQAPAGQPSAAAAAAAASAPASETPATTAGPSGTPTSAATPATTTPAATPAPGTTSQSTPAAPSAPSGTVPAPNTQPTAAPPI